MSGFTKLFSSITDSTIWQESDHTRLVWITMLAMCDQNGYVAASIPGLAARARVPLESCLQALESFQKPDKWSRTVDFDGKRIVVTDGGWLLLNYGKYREIQDANKRREQARVGMAKIRGERKLSNVNKVSSGELRLTQAEAEAEAEAEAIKTLAPNEKISFNAEAGIKNISDVEFSNWKKAFPAILLENEIAKAEAWLRANPKNTKKNVARFLTNWFSRAQDKAPRVNQNDDIMRGVM